MVRTFLRYSLAWKSKIRDLGFGASPVLSGGPGPARAGARGARPPRFPAAAQWVAGGSPNASSQPRQGHSLSALHQLKLQACPYASSASESLQSLRNTSDLAFLSELPLLKQWDMFWTPRDLCQLSRKAGVWCNAKLIFLLFFNSLFIPSKGSQVVKKSKRLRYLCKCFRKPRWTLFHIVKLKQSWWVTRGRVVIGQKRSVLSSGGF